MGSYYTLGASLPDLRVDDTKTEISTQEFVETLRGEAGKRDRELIDLILLQGDNRRLIALLKEKPLPVLYSPTAIGEEELRRYVESMKDPEEDEEVDTSHIPGYMQRFVKQYLSGKWSSVPYFPEDILQGMYLEHVSKRADEFVNQWFQLHQYITNVLAAMTAKKFELDRKKYLVGDTELVEILRSGSWGELKHLDDSDIIQQIVKIGEEASLEHKERRIDELKWKILDNLTFADPFSIDAMIAYLLKLQILERWIVLDRERGKQRLQKLLDELKKQGKEELEDFLDHSQKKKTPL